METKLEVSKELKSILKSLKLPTNKKHLIVDNLYEDDTYQLKFKNRTDLDDAMQKIRDASTTRNFGYRWGEWAAYARIKFEDDRVLHFHAPNMANGDRNYWEYYNIKGGVSNRILLRNEDEF